MQVAVSRAITSLSVPARLRLTLPAVTSMADIGTVATGMQECQPAAVIMKCTAFYEAYSFSAHR